MTSISSGTTVSFTTPRLHTRCDGMPHSCGKRRTISSSFSATRTTHRTSYRSGSLRPTQKNLSKTSHRPQMLLPQRHPRPRPRPRPPTMCLSHSGTRFVGTPNHASSSTSWMPNSQISKMAPTQRIPRRPSMCCTRCQHPIYIHSLQPCHSPHPPHSNGGGPPVHQMPCSALACLSYHMRDMLSTTSLTRHIPRGCQVKELASRA